MYEVAARLDPDSYLRLARAVYAEMALAGVSCVGEFHYLHHQPGGRPYADPNAMGRALVQAAAEAGLRMTLLDTCYLAGGLAPAEPRGAAAGRRPAALRRRRRRGGGRRGPRASASTSTGMISPARQGGAAIHSVRAVPRGQMHPVMAWAAPVRCPAARAHVRAAGRERGVPGRSTASRPAELLYERGRARAADHRRARHPRRRRRPGPARRQRRVRLPVPDHRGATWATASARRRRWPRPAAR